MKSTWKRILPILLVLLIFASIFWYLVDYDKDFTREILLDQARFFEQHERGDLAEIFYNLAYRQAKGSAQVAIELADRYKATGNYTRAEYTLSSAIADGATAELYIALCKTYVEQDKLLDAVRMLGSITDPEIVSQIDAIRPQVPTVTPAPGFYSQYISLTVASDNTVYISTDGQFPSVSEDKTDGVIHLKAGENTVYAIAVGENGLVSPLSVLGYTIGGVIEEVNLTDPQLEQTVREQLKMEDGQPIMTNDLWSITQLTLPENAAISDLQYFPELTQLTVPRNSSQDFSCLSGLTKLEKLEISNANLSTGTLETISTLPNLKELRLTSCGLSNIRALSNAAGLQVLDLSSNSIRDISPLSGLENLTQLNLSYNALTDLNNLSGLSKLTHLNVDANSLASLAPLSSCTELVSLDASQNSISSLTGLSKLSNLTHLYVSGNNLTEVDLLADCVNLAELDISRNTVLDISALSGLSRLEVLLFAHNEISAVPAFAKDCALVLIDGSHNMLVDVDALAGCQDLNTVRMDYNFISEVNILAQCPNLIQVDVSGNPVSDVSELEKQSIIVHYTPEL